MSKKQKRLNPYIKYSGLAFQLLAGILLGWWIGKMADAYFANSQPFFMVGLILFFLVGTLYSVIREVLNDTDD